MSSPETTTSPSPRPRWRTVTAWILLVLGCVLAPLSVASIWVRNQLLDTDRYVATVTPLATDPAIISFTATEITDSLFAAVDVETIAEDALPSGASAFAAPLTGALEGFVTTQVEKVLETDQFEQVWVDANRRAHEQVVRLLTSSGDRSETVAVDLANILTRVQLALKDRGISVFDDVPIDQVAVKLELFKSEPLAKARSATDLLDTLANVLPILALASLGGAIGLSFDRRRSVVRVGLGLAISMVVLGTALALGRHFYLGAVEGTIPADAATAVFDIVVRFLRDGLRVVLTVGVLMALVGIALGPSRAARRFRATLEAGFGKAGARGGEPGPVPRWVAAHRRALQVVAIALGGLLLTFWSQPTPWVVLGLVLLVLVLLAAIEVLARAGGGPDAGSPTAPTSTDV